MSLFNLLQTHHIQATPAVLNKTETFTHSSLVPTQNRMLPLDSSRSSRWTFGACQRRLRRQQCCFSGKKLKCVKRRCLFLWKRTLARTKTRDQALKKRMRTEEK